jgi:hypothetical protein
MQKRAAAAAQAELDADSKRFQAAAKPVAEAPPAAASAPPNDPKKTVKAFVDLCRNANRLGLEGPNSLDPAECVGQWWALDMRGKGHTVKDMSLSDKEELIALSQVVKDMSPKIGQSKSEVEGGLWGKPNSVNSTTTAAGVREQWIYGPGHYLYFVNDVLTTWTSPGIVNTPGL